MNQPAPPQQLRPLRHSLSPESVKLLADYWAATGKTPTPTHLMLVDDSGEREIGKTACLWADDRANPCGEYVTSDSKQVTCQACLEQAHA